MITKNESDIREKLLNEVQRFENKQKSSNEIREKVDTNENSLKRNRELLDEYKKNVPKPPNNKKKKTVTASPETPDYIKKKSSTEKLGKRFQQQKEEAEQENNDEDVIGQYSEQEDEKEEDEGRVNLKLNPSEELEELLICYKEGNNTKTPLCERGNEVSDTNSPLRLTEQKHKPLINVLTSPTSHQQTYSKKEPVELSFQNYNEAEWIDKISGAIELDIKLEDADMSNANEVMVKLQSLFTSNKTKITTLMTNNEQQIQQVKTEFEEKIKQLEDAKNFKMNEWLNKAISKTS